MDQRTGDIQQSIEATRQDMEDTRSAMTEKLEILEDRVRETVEGAASTVEGIVSNVKETVDTTVEAVKQTVEDTRSSVEGIVENVKGTVGETVESVKNTFDLSYQVDRRPWLMFGGAILTGYMLGNWGSGSRPSSVFAANRSDSSLSDPMAEAYYAQPTGATSFGESSYQPHQPQQPSKWSGILDQFENEINLIKGAAVGTLIGVIRDMVKQAVPAITPYFDKALAQPEGQSPEAAKQYNSARAGEQHSASGNNTV
ncbi:MAG: hypothetical protein ACRERD_31975 [Candidatus Binatia bacterium]